MALSAEPRAGSSLCSKAYCSGAPLLAEKMINLYTESFPEQPAHFFSKGFMGKFFSAASLAILVVACILLPSCGGGNPTTVSKEVPPSGVTLSPGPNVSLEVGKGLIF